MKAVDQLQEVLRLESDDERSELRSDEARVTIDKNGAFIQGLTRTLSNWILKSGRSYIVRINHEINFRIEIRIDDFKNPSPVDVPFRCRVVVPSETDNKQANAETAARHLWHAEEPPLEVFKRKMRKAADQWWQEVGVKQGYPVKVALYRKRQELAEAVAKALNQQGLRVAVVADIDESWDAPPVHLAGLALRVRLSDYVDREFDLDLDLALEVVGVTERLDPRHPKSNAEWSDRIIKCVHKTVLDKVTLSCYFYDRANLEKTIKNAIDTDVAPFGRKCKWLTAKAKPPEYKQHEPLDVPFTWQALHGRNVEFKARLEAAVLPENAAKYLRNGPLDLSAWFKQLLPDITRRLLLSCDYTVLSPEYTKDLERRIEKEVSAKADALGIKVETLVLQDLLDEWRYLKPFEIDVPDRSYDSSVADLPLRFDMSISGFFNSLEDIKNFTFPEDKVLVEVVRVAELAAASVARDISMEEYLSDWERSLVGGTSINKINSHDDVSDEPAHQAFVGASRSMVNIPQNGFKEGYIGVRDRIANEVTRLLVSRLKMQVLSVKPRQHDSDLIAYVRSVERAKDIRISDFRFSPHDLHLESETIGADAIIRVGGISPSEALQLKHKNIQFSDIEVTLHDFLRVILTGIPTDYFKSALKNQGESLRKKIEKDLQDKTKKYGLNVSLLHFGVKSSLILRDRRRVIREEANLVADELRLNQIKHERRAGASDLTHVDELTNVSRAAEIAALKSYQESSEQLLKQGVADGSESIESIEKRKQSLTKVRQAAQPLNLGSRVLKASGETPKATGLDNDEGSEGNSDSDFY